MPFERLSLLPNIDGGVGDDPSSNLEHLSMYKLYDPMSVRSNGHEA